MSDQQWYAIFADTDYCGGRECFVITRDPINSENALRERYIFWIGKGNVRSVGPFATAADAAQAKET